MQRLSESSAGLWKKISLPNFFSQKIFIYPTETFYALGCSAYCGKSIEKIYNLKQREKNKPLLVLVENWEMLKKYASKQNYNSNVLENFLKLITRTLQQSCKTKDCCLINKISRRRKNWV